MYLVSCILLPGFLILSLGLIDRFVLNEKERFRLHRSGLEAFQQNDYNSAVFYWEKLLQHDPDDKSVHFKTGRAFFHLGELHKAAEHYFKSVELDPENGWGWYELARVELLQGEKDACKEYLSKARKYLDNEPRVFILEGDFLLTQQQYQKAEQSYKQARLLAPDNPMALVRLATCLAVQGRESESGEVFDALLIQAPTKAMILLSMADYWMLLGKYARAESILSKGLDLHPDDLLFAQRLAEWFFDSGKHKEAQSYLQYMLKRYPDHTYARKLHTEILLAEGDLEEARAQLQKLDEIRQNDTELTLLNGKLHLLAGNPARANSFFQKAIDDFPKLSLPHYLKGVTLLQQGHIHLARKSFVRALAHDPLYSEAELALADLALYQGDFSTALEYAHRVKKHDAANPRTLLIEGIILLLQKNFNLAERSFLHAEQLARDPQAARYFQAKAAEQGGQQSRALQLYKHVITEKPQYIDVSMDYTSLLLEGGRLEEAEALFSDLTGSSRQKGYMYALLGMINRIQDNAKKAEKCWLTALKEEMRPVSVYLSLAKLYRESDQPHKEKAILKRCIEEHPSQRYGYIQLSALHVKKHSYVKAIHVLEKGLRYNQKDALLLSNLSWLLLHTEADLLRALTLAQEAYRRNPNEPAVVDTLGWAYYRKKLYTRAVWHLQEALELAPNHPEIRRHLDKALQAQKSVNQLIGEAEDQEALHRRLRPQG